MHGPHCAREHEDFKPHCPDCQADHAAMAEVLEAQAVEADTVVARLSGAGINVPASMYAAARIEALAEALLVTQRARMAFEYVTGTKVIEQLHAGQRQMAADTGSLMLPTKKPGQALHLP
jgi:hypothetical protein